MEAILFGKDMKEKVRTAKSACIYLRKGDYHHTCDDAVLWFEEENMQFQLLIICDGVSGESFGYEAAKIAIHEIKKEIVAKFGLVPPNTLLQNAITRAHQSITSGATTVSVVLLRTNGTFYFANVGDSHIYKIGNKKVKRLSKDEKEAVGTTIEVHRAIRRFVMQALGAEIKKIQIGTGKLKKGERILVATDGLCDNLFIETKDRIVIDASGEKDIEEVIRNKKEPAEITEALVKEIKKRMQLKEIVQKKNNVLIPKNDDISIGIIRQG